jgi:hypothetical protein
MEERLLMPRRHRAARRGDRVEVLAGRPPAEFRSFDGWLYAEGLRDYTNRLEAWIADELGKPPEVGASLAVKVMTAAGLPVADWYRAAHVDYVMVRF